MWFLPSYGRPDNITALLASPGGLPDQITVVLNEDDPRLSEYHDKIPPWWDIELVRPGARFGEVWREIFKRHPNEPWYGTLTDDMVPETKDWHTKLIEAAGDRHVALPSGQHQFPALRNICVLGGAFVRAMGDIVPPGFRHNFIDNVWEQCATDFGLMRPLENVIVKHKHWLFGTAEKDATHERGSADFEQDRKTFHAWLNSDERREACIRIAQMVGANISLTDTSKIHLAICVPMGSTTIDYGYHRSFHNMMATLFKKGINATVFEVAGGSHVGKARERALWNAMKQTACTHILWLDDDMGFDPKWVMRLICCGHEFACAVGVRKVDHLSLCCNYKSAQIRVHPHTKFVELRHVGFAFVLMQRSVIDKMCAAYPELQYDTGKEPPEWALFLDMIDTKEKTPGERLSEDYSFCERWMRIGGEIWADPEATLIHAGRKEYTGKLADALRIEPPSPGEAIAA